MCVLFQLGIVQVTLIVTGLSIQPICGESRPGGEVMNRAILDD